MRFTEHELTLAVTAAAKSVAAAGRAGRKARRTADPDAVWESMGRYERYQVMDAVGTQVLPVLLALPDVEVAAGERPRFTDAQVLAAVEQTLDTGGLGRLRRKVVAASLTVLVRTALAQLPPRQDPDALVVPDHL
ncbi:MAG: hypothetical protein LT071_07680 [Nocardioides sp.]|nr:hypothetical protein [Nocardioides sp.]